MKNNQKGFTLVELLIVIVIIGILSGVAISVIDPKKQQDRTHDANIKATISKVAMATESYISAFGNAPSPKEFVNGLKNVKVDGCTEVADTATECVFTIEGNPLPSTCSASGWNETTGSTACNFRYIRNDPSDTMVDSTAFTLYARSFSFPDSVFKYSNTKGVIFLCPADGDLGDSCVEQK